MKVLKLDTVSYNKEMAYFRSQPQQETKGSSFP